MRKTVLFTFAALLTSAAVAQTGEITSARGENWLSQDGDWGLTFDANPLLNYAGNLFNGNTGNSIGSGLTWANPWFAIQGKKMVAADKAYRAKLRIGFNSFKETALVTQSGQSDPAVTVEDTHKASDFNLVLGVGMEKRVGSTRVVGVYGAEAYIALGTHKDSYEYGNPLADDNTVNAPQFDQATGVTEAKAGSTFGFGVAGFIGVEWFCAPKISLSGEYTWGLMLSSTGFGETTTESWDAVDSSVETTTVEGPTGKEFNFGIDTGVTGANVGINFYFQ
ncbi:MAG: hypothetical protein ABI599_06370 [Flavobacteriales bacterium]